MKESELMKFDWVMFDEENYEPYEISRVYMQVEHFNCGVVYGKDQSGYGTCIAHCEEDSLYNSRKYGKVMPIPLTPEILEKNGFARALNFSTECYTKRGVDYSIKYRPNDYHILKVHKPQTCGQTGHCTLTITNCLYLHQIQHALRLCGLNELADNLRIE